MYFFQLHTRKNSGINPRQSKTCCASTPSCLNLSETWSTVSVRMKSKFWIWVHLLLFFKLSGIPRCWKRKCERRHLYRTCKQTNEYQNTVRDRKLWYLRASFKNFFSLERDVNCQDLGPGPNVQKRLPLTDTRDRGQPAYHEEPEKWKSWLSCK